MGIEPNPAVIRRIADLPFSALSRVGSIDRRPKSYYCRTILGEPRKGLRGHRKHGDPLNLIQFMLA